MTPISIMQKQPVLNRRVLVYDTNTHKWLFGFRRDPDLFKGEWFVEFMPTWYDPTVSHWMPTPDDPI